MPLLGTPLVMSLLLPLVHPRQRAIHLAPKSTTQSLSDEPNGSQTSDGLLRVTAEEEDAHAKAMEVYKDIVSVCASAKSHEQYIINQTQRYYRMRSDSAIEKLLGNQG